MMVVPVLITSCQVSEYLKIGPQMAQIITIDAAMINAPEVPVRCVTLLENLSKKERLFLFFIAYIFCVKQGRNCISYQCKNRHKLSFVMDDLANRRVGFGQIFCRGYFHPLNFFNILISLWY